MLNKKIKKTIISKLLLAIACFLFYNPPIVSGQEGHEIAIKVPIRPKQKVYLSSGLDAYLLSSSFLSKNGGNAQLTIPRFTVFVNIGLNLNYDFNSNIGMFTGLGIKNIGFIEKTGQLTIKRRNYTFGIPLGLKIGNVTSGNFLLIGGGVDFPFNYREKRFVKRTDKTKFNEWFSKRTPTAMGYVFLGVHLNPGFVVKLQYYPGNFLNPNFTEMVNGIAVKPYRSYKVNLMLLSFGIDLPYHPKKMIESIKK